jgi:autophagy-related protein 2
VELHSSHVGHIIARIPWPNPLTSTLGLSLQSLHLTLDLLDNQSTGQPNQTSNLADSVATVAAEFLHDELSPGEEATLRESFHPDRGSPPDPADYVPGGIDPFLNTEEFAPGDTDPDGVGIFASLIERLLARFAFDAVDTRLTIRHPGRSSFTLIIPNIRYETESEVPFTDATVRNDATGETRTITISGVEIKMSDLRTEDSTKPAFPSITSSVTSLPSHPPHDQLPRGPRSRSPSPDSDIDDETQMMMSQSVAFLPPQPLGSSSISASVASSMYHSAVSETPFRPTAIREPIQEVQEKLPVEPAAKPEGLPSSTSQDQPSSGDVSPHGADVPEETVFSCGSDPIVIRLTTPPSSESRPGQQRVEKRDESLRLSITTGALGFALRARHIQSLTELVATLGGISSTSPSPPKSQGTTPVSSLLSRLNISIHIRGIVGLLLLSREPSYELTRVDFFHHQLIPPKLLHGYIRIHADGISASLSHPLAVVRGDRRTPGMTKIGASLTTTDLTAFLFEPSGSSLGPEQTASPILITDPNILAQYTSSHAHPVNQHTPCTNCPTFDILDWASAANKGTTPKPSHWRARIPQNHAQQRIPTHGPSGSVGALGLSPSPGKSNPDFLQKSSVHSPPVISIAVTIASGGHKSKKGESVPESRTHVEMRIAPLHLFVDLGALHSSQGHGLLEFLQDSIPVSLPLTKGDVSEDLHGEISEEDEKDTPPATPRRFTGFSRRDSDRQRERQRLEQMVLDDLDLKFDYRSSTPKQSPQSLPSEKVKAWREVITCAIFCRSQS